MTRVTINQKFTAVGERAAGETPSEAVLKAAEMFGIGLDETYEVTLYDGLVLDVRPGDVVFAAGPSGSGKSVLLVRLAEALRRAWGDEARLVDLASVQLADRPVIDLMRPPLETALRRLSTAGLADAFVLLRTPRELSDGQRYRMRLAKAIEACAPDGRALACGSRLSGGGAAAGGAATTALLFADEFCSTLDRLCARAVAYRVRRLAREEGVTVLAASAHDDLIEDLAPDVLITRHEGRGVEVRYADPSRDAGLSGAPKASALAVGSRLSGGGAAAATAEQGALAAGSRPNVRQARCSLLEHIAIERGTGADWAALAPLHYRSHRAGAVTDVFRMVYDPTAPLAAADTAAGVAAAATAEQGALAVGSRLSGGGAAAGTAAPDTAAGVAAPATAEQALVGVIVYSRAALSLAARDRATGSRYSAAGLGRVATADLINRELRVISRVVLTPNWRGLGLATRLVAETLPQVGTPYVEALAAMGEMHPFFVRAGMTAYPPAPSAQGERLRAALEAAGLARADRRSAGSLEAAIGRLDPAARGLAEAEIQRWARSYLAAKNHRENRPGRRRMLELVARHLDSTPVYYLWRRPDPAPSAAAGAAAAISTNVAAAATAKRDHELGETSCT
jgi:hypothetical protein